MAYWQLQYWNTRLKATKKQAPSNVRASHSAMHNPIQVYKIDIREDVNNHKVWCKNLSSSLCTAVERTSQMDSGLFVLVSQRVGVSFARLSSSCQELHMSPLEHCPFTFH